MSAIKTRDIEQSLKKKGFKLDNTHHSIYWFYLGTRKSSIRTRISHGSTEYGDNLLSQIGKQMGLNRKELSSFVECQLTEERYREILVERKKITLE